MGAMPMTGGAAAAMAGMPMGGHGGPGAAASFLAMWTVMMIGMMLPSLALALSRYRRSLGSAGRLPPALLMVPAAAGYGLVWLLLGVAVYCLDLAAAAVAVRAAAAARALPMAVGPLVLLAGALQLTRWKSRQLARCRNDCRRGSFSSGRQSSVSVLAACRQGMRLGLHCSRCCGALSLALVAAGMMSWPAMLAAGLAMNLERLAPSGGRVARTVGILVIGAGIALTLRAVDLR